MSCLTAGTFWHPTTELTKTTKQPRRENIIMKKLHPTLSPGPLWPDGDHGASADDVRTLQLKWVTQAQFAGYYVDAGIRGSMKKKDRTSDQTDAVRISANTGSGRWRSDVAVNGCLPLWPRVKKGLPMVQYRTAVQVVCYECLTCRKDADRDTDDFKQDPWPSGSLATEFPFLKLDEQLELAHRRARGWGYRF